MTHQLSASKQFAQDGYALLPGVVNVNDCERMAERVSHFNASIASVAPPGTRNLLSQPWCQDFAAQLRTNPSLASLIPANFVGAQCSYFEKSAANNWLVPVHQDLSIPVAQRIDHPNLSGWSVKEGVRYVQAPTALLQTLIAMRVHLDDCLAADGALQIVPGSHRQGRIAQAKVAGLREAAGTVTCELTCGGVLVLSPLLLHASSKSIGASRRRVLHYLFGPPTLPFGLRWAMDV
jgi:ectoine hydroxylase-related dioxygenase (phytanoyl-CoA dioxygenase family)